MTPSLRDRESFIEAARDRIAEKRARLLPVGSAPEDDRAFEEKYHYLVEGLRRTFDAIGEPGLEVETFGSSGLRIAFRLNDPQEGTPIVDREIRISRIDATEEVHLVFSSFQRAERHASFPLSRPDLPRVEAGFIDFLVEGIEPAWVSRRKRPATREDEAAAGAQEPVQGTLELPLEPG